MAKKKELKTNVKLKDVDQEMLKEVLVESIEQNEKQLCVYLIQRKIEGKSDENTASINGINAYIEQQNKFLINNFK